MTIAGDRAYKIYAGKKDEGYSSKSLCIPDSDVHQLRLKTAAEMFARVDKGEAEVITDLGAGFADLLPHLREHGYTHGYIGVESQKWMCEKAWEVNRATMVAMDVFSFLKENFKKSIGLPKNPLPVFALGLIATMTEWEVTQLAKHMRRYSRGGPMILSWQSSHLYTGQFQSWDTDFLTKHFGDLKDAVYTDTEITGLFHD